MQTRHSHGLEQFCASIQDQTGLRILDLAGASQSTVSFVTNLGHSLYSDDIQLTLDAVFGQGDFFENQANPRYLGQFLSETLTFPEAHFDGALVWDALQFLAPPLLQAVVDRLRRVLRPHASLLAFFHAEEKLETIPTYFYRIVDSRTLALVPRGQRRPAQFFNNRSLEKLFQEFHSVKFFLTRDYLREVIVKR